MPAPVLVNDVVFAPVPALTMAAARVLVPVLEPCNVNEAGAEVELKAIVPVFVNKTAPLPDASSVPPLVPIVKRRSVLAPKPVYWNTPPLITRFPAALEDWPMPLAVPPMVRLFVLSVPALIVVVPEKVFEPVSARVPDPNFVMP